MGGGYLDSWVLTMPEPYLQEHQVRQLVKTFALYAYFDESLWPEIEQAETNADLYKKFMDQYQREFFGDLQRGGADRIRTCVKHDVSSSYEYEQL
jgi:hypothetical protein